MSSTLRILDTFNTVDLTTTNERLLYTDSGGVNGPYCANERMTVVVVNNDPSDPMIYMALRAFDTEHGYDFLEVRDADGLRLCRKSGTLDPMVCAKCTRRMTISWSSDILIQNQGFVFELFKGREITKSGHTFGPGVDLRGVTLDGVNLDGVDLSYANLAGVHATNASLVGANLRCTNWTDACIDGATLRGATLDGVHGQLHRASPTSPLPTLPGAYRAVYRAGDDFYHIVGPRVRLNGADLSDCDLSNLDLTGVEFTDAICNQRTRWDHATLALVSGGLKCSLADAPTANLPASYRFVQVTGGDDAATPGASRLFIAGPGVTLSGVDLSNADLSNLDLSRSKLDNVRLGGATLDGVNLTDAVLTGAGGMFKVSAAAPRPIVPWNYVVQSDDTSPQSYHIIGPSVKVDGASFRGARWKNMDLSNIQIKATDLSHADLRGANLSRSDMQSVNFSSASLRRANLDLASVTNVNFAHADLGRLRAVGTLFNTVEFAHANLSTCDWTHVSRFIHCYGDKRTQLPPNATSKRVKTNHRTDQTRRLIRIHHATVDDAPQSVPIK